MAEKETLDETVINPGDIVFECPHCGKSLAIEARGAGMVIVCPDCQARVQVPAPADEDAAAEDVVEGMSRRMNQLRADNIDYFEEVGKELALIQAALDRIVGIIQDATAENVPPR